MKCLVASLLLLTVLLAGCPAKIVYIPVYKCDEPPVVTMPKLLVQELPETAQTNEKLQALGMDYLQLRNSLEQCIIFLNAYRGKQ